MTIKNYLQHKNSKTIAQCANSALTRISSYHKLGINKNCLLTSLHFTPHCFFTAILYNYRVVGTYSHRLSFILYRYASSSLFKEDGFFFIRHNKRYVATAFAWQDKLNSLEGRLHWLAVLPEYHRQGLGRALALRVLLYHKDHGKESVSLITEVYRHSALKLYKDIGFVCSAEET